MWRWDIKWLDVVNQTLIKSELSIRLECKPDLIWVIFLTGVYITRRCNCSLAHFTPLKPSVFLSYFKGTVFLIALMRKLLLFAASLNMLTCLHPVSSFYVVLSKNPVLFSLAEFSVFVKHGFEYEKAADALFFSLSCSVSSGKCFFFLLKRQTCQGHFKTEYFSLLFSLSSVLLGGRRSRCCSTSACPLIK